MFEIPGELRALLPTLLCGHIINLKESEVFAPKKCGRSHLKTLFPSFARKTGLTLSP